VITICKHPEVRDNPRLLYLLGRALPAYFIHWVVTAAVSPDFGLIDSVYELIEPHEEMLRQSMAFMWPGRYAAGDNMAYCDDPRVRVTTVHVCGREYVFLPHPVPVALQRELEKGNRRRLVWPYLLAYTDEYYCVTYVSEYNRTAEATYYNGAEDTPRRAMTFAVRKCGKNNALLHKVILHEY
jgi:hypothetical protein